MDAELRRLTARTTGLWRRGRVPLLLVSYLLWTLVTVLPRPWSWHSTITGSHADALLNVAVLDWVSDHVLDWNTLWQGQFFQPNRLTIAYADVVLPQSLLFGLLRPIVGLAGAFNVIELSAWMVALWSCHCLMHRFCPNDAAAFVGSIGWNFSMVRVTQLELFQFVTAGALIPVVLLALLRLLERPTAARGVALGLSLAGVTLAANYYGPMMALATAVIGIVLALVRRNFGLKRLVVPLVVGAVVGAALVLPVWWQYQRLQQDPHFVREPVARFSTQPSDLIAVSEFSESLAGAPGMDIAANPLFPGVVIGLLGSVGVMIGLSRVRRNLEMLALLGVGVLMLILSGGDHSWTFGLGWFHPYRWVAAIVPGFEGIRAPARFATLFQFSLAVSAVVALDRMRTYSRVVFGLVGAMALVALLIETRVVTPVVRVPDRQEWAGVNDVLRRLPNGLAVELPLVLEIRGGSVIEAPRMVLARRDGHPRINGYSGFEPPRYERVASIVNRFPAAPAVAWLERNDVRYVIVRTSIVGHTDPTLRRIYEGFQPRLDGPAIERLLLERPPWVSRARRVGDAILIELRHDGAARRLGPPAGHPLSIP